MAYIDADNPHKYKSLKSILVDINGTLIPYFIQKIEMKEKGFALFVIEGFQSREDALGISGKEVYLPLSQLPPLPDDQYYLHDLQGMEVVDKTNGAVGKVEKVFDYAQNTLIQVFNQHHEVLIPLNDRFVQRVDKTAGVVYVDVPLELLEMNKI